MDETLNISNRIPPDPPCLVYDMGREAFVFILDGKEVLSIHRDGKVMVHCRPCGDDREVFLALKRFLDIQPHEEGL